MTELYLLSSTAAAVLSGAASITATTAVSAASLATSTVDTGSIESIVTSLVPSIVASLLPSAATTTAPVTAQPVFLPVPFEVAAIFAGALSGAMAAVNRRFDLTGLLVLAVVNGLGGGIIRDVLLQNHGIFALDNPRALIAVMIAAGVGAFFFTVAEKIRPMLGVIDALSLGLFTLVGADKALVAGFSPMAAILLGMITAIGGGIMRDLLCDLEPQVMRRGSLYAIAAFAGSSIFVAMVMWLNFTKPVAIVVSATVAVGLRLGSLRHGWASPEPIDLTNHVTGAPARLWRAGGTVMRRTLRRKDDSDDAGPLN